MKIQILNPDSENCTITPGHFFRDSFDYFAKILKDTPIKWSGEPSQMLAVTNVDLDGLTEISWADTNIVFAETCQQIYDLSYKLDFTKAYIFVTESWIDFDILKEKFYGLPLIGHYAVFNEVFSYGTDLFTVKNQFTWLDKSKELPEYDYFCLIGRASSLRGRFIYELAKQNLSNSLVKYNGKVIGDSGAPAKFDRLDYSNGFFAVAAETAVGGILPSKLIQSTLYNNFRAEVQFETDAIGGQGWDLTEYHVTEKTLKPLIMNKPCLMYGPVGYTQWLSTLGIDLGHGNFECAYDLIENDVNRVCAVVEEIKNINWDTVSPSEQHSVQNLLGFHKMCNLSKQNCIDLYRRIRLIAS